MARLPVTLTRRLATLEAARSKAGRKLSGVELESAVAAYERLLFETRVLPSVSEGIGVTPLEAAERYFDLIARAQVQ